MKSALPRVLIVMSFAVLGLSACGSSNSDDNSGSAPVVTAVGTDAQVIEQFAQVWVGQASEAGLPADQACVMTVASQLEAADVQRLRENIKLPTLSAAGQALLNDKLSRCIVAPTTTASASTSTSTP
jgi:hypothetical protein